VLVWFVSLGFFFLFVPLYICESRFWLDALLLEHKEVNKKWNKQTKTKKKIECTLWVSFCFFLFFSPFFFFYESLAIQ
jgi:hypothetical protein